MAITKVIELEVIADDLVSSLDIFDGENFVVENIVLIDNSFDVFIAGVIHAAFPSVGVSPFLELY